MSAGNLPAKRSEFTKDFACDPFEWIGSADSLGSITWAEGEEIWVARVDQVGKWFNWKVWRFGQFGERVYGSAPSLEEAKSEAEECMRAKVGEAA